jgi:hypothetical protein
LTDVAYKKVVDRLLSVVPEIQSDYECEAEFWSPQAVPAHIVYGSVFVRFITRLVAESSSNDDPERDELLSRCFELIEELSVSSDFETRCVIEASVLEALLREPGDWKRFHELFRPNTMKLAQKLWFQ